MTTHTSKPEAAIGCPALRNYPLVVGSITVAVIVAVAILGPEIVDHDPNSSDFVFGRGEFGLPGRPSVKHLLGTDALYRDLLARLLSGARTSLVIAAVATAATTTVGSFVGLVAGLTYGSRLGFVDSVLMRVVDACLAFPYLLLVMAIGAIVDRSDSATIIAILGATGWLGTSRIVRAKTIQITKLDYIVAARAIGQSNTGICLHHILPNIAGPIIVCASTSIASMVLAESVLSYLSVGIQPPTATWGRMLREGQTFFTADPRLVAVPGIAILATVLAFNLLGEGLRDSIDSHKHR